MSSIKIVNDIRDVQGAKALPHTLTEASAPHKMLRAKPISQKRVYSDQLICLAALTVMAVWRYGARAGLIAGVALLTAAVVDWLGCKFSGKVYNIKDLSTYASGLCFALMCPASIDYGLVAMGAALAMIVKHIFGGKDNYIFNPTAVSVAFIIICYPASMLLYPQVGEKLPLTGAMEGILTNGVESYLRKLETARQIAPLDLILGNFPGSMGTTHVLIILICGLCLLLRRSISFPVTASAVLSVMALAPFLQLYDRFSDMLILELTGGYMLFGILFLAGDPQTLPKGILARIYYGIILGVSMTLFRFFGKVEGGFVFALLIANALSLRCDALAAATVNMLKSVARFYRTHMPMYEHFRDAAKQGEQPAALINLEHTMEIDISTLRFETPPIDNEVVKIRRRRRLHIPAIHKMRRNIRKRRIIRQNSRIPLPKEMTLPLREKAVVRKAVNSLRHLHFYLKKLAAKPAKAHPQTIDAAHADGIPFTPDDLVLVTPAQMTNEQFSTGASTDFSTPAAEDTQNAEALPAVEVWKEPFVDENIEVKPFAELSDLTPEQGDSDENPPPQNVQDAEFTEVGAEK
jgi:electron transport complex protein RnfD